MLETKLNKFSRTSRLVRQADFDCVFAQGRRFKTPNMTIRIAANNIGKPRLGISIGTRFGNAVERNRMKRKLREAFRHIQSTLPVCDIVCVPYPSARDLAGGQIVEVIKNACESFNNKHAKPDQKI
jgi:ribonuclease P protein component